jgi:hypothetical protein
VSGASINRKVSARELRRQLQNEAQNTEIALHNEKLTRERLDKQAAALGEFFSRSLWGRLKWLTTGK